MEHLNFVSSMFQEEDYIENLFPSSDGTDANLAESKILWKDSFSSLVNKKNNAEKLPDLELMTMMRKDTMVTRKQNMNKKFDKPTSCPQESKGVCVELYNFLWNKEPRFQTSCINVNQPDTVIIINGVINNWFLFSKNRIIKKRKENSTMENLKKSFLKDVSKSNIVGCFIKFSNHQTKKNDFEINYFDEAEFIDFMNNMVKYCETGILQRFIDPQGEHDNLIKFSWSNDICKSEYIISKAKIFDNKLNIYERCNLLTNDPRYVDIKPIRGVLMTKSIEHIVSCINNHIFLTSYGVYMLESGTFYFKLCKNNCIWLQFATSIKVVGTKDYPEVKNDALNFSQPKHIDLNNTLIGLRKTDLLKSHICYCCFEKFNKDKIYEITNESYLSCLEGINKYYKIYPTSEISKVRFNQKASKELFSERKSNKIFSFLLSNDQKLSQHYCNDFKNETEDQSKGEQSAWMNIGPKKKECCPQNNKVDSHKPAPDKKKIPPVYKYFYPDLTVKEFNELKSNDEFLKTCITVCDLCYVDLLGHKISGGNKLVNKFDSTSKLSGTGILMPENAVKQYFIGVNVEKPNWEKLEFMYDENLENKSVDEIDNKVPLEKLYKVNNEINSNIIPEKNYSSFEQGDIEKSSQINYQLKSGITNEKNKHFNSSTNLSNSNNVSKIKQDNIYYLRSISNDSINENDTKPDPKNLTTDSQFSTTFLIEKIVPAFLKCKPKLQNDNLTPEKAKGIRVNTSSYNNNSFKNVDNIGNNDKINKNKSHKDLSSNVQRDSTIDESNLGFKIKSDYKEENKNRLKSLVKCVSRDSSLNLLIKVDSSNKLQNKVKNVYRQKTVINNSQYLYDHHKIKSQEKKKNRSLSKIVDKKINQTDISAPFLFKKDKKLLGNQFSYTKNESEKITDNIQKPENTSKQVPKIEVLRKNKSITCTDFYSPNNTLRNMSQANISYYSRDSSNQVTDFQYNADKGCKPEMHSTWKELPGFFNKSRIDFLSPTSSFLQLDKMKRFERDRRSKRNPILSFRK